MLKNPSSHLAAVLQALFVTFLWSTSWVLIKFGLNDIPALTFAGLRYCLAFLCLLPLALRPAGRASIRNLTRSDWRALALLGLLMIAITQGAQYLGLAHLPAITVSLLYNFTPAAVALLSIALLAERPTAMQWGGVALYMVGVAVYFLPVLVPEGEALGIGIVLVGVLANALSAVLGRHVNRSGRIDPLTVTIVSMGIGAVILAVSGIVTQGLPALSPGNWLVIGWLAVVNTAFTFPLWNHTLRTLSATESSIINSMMLVQIAVLAWLFLGERPDAQDILGMALVMAGVLIVQLKRRPVGAGAQTPEVSNQRSEVGS